MERESGGLMYYFVSDPEISSPTCIVGTEYFAHADIHSGSHSKIDRSMPPALELDRKVAVLYRLSR